MLNCIFLFFFFFFFTFFEGLNHDSGSLEDRCYSYDPCHNGWVQTQGLSESRAWAVGVVTSDDEPWILGGENADGVTLKTSQIWRAFQQDWEKGPGETGRRANKEK